MYATPLMPPHIVARYSVNRKALRNSKISPPDIVESCMNEVEFRERKSALEKSAIRSDLLA